MLHDYINSATLSSIPQITTRLLLLITIIITYKLEMPIVPPDSVHTLLECPPFLEMATSFDLFQSYAFHPQCQ
jgi:hypothetical protein